MYIVLSSKHGGDIKFLDQGNGKTREIYYTDNECRLQCAVLNGKTVNITIYPQLEVGSVATEFESPKGYTTIPITFPMLGKNYYNAEITTKIQNGVQWSGGEYYTIVASGTPTDYSCIVTGTCEIPTSGKICLSANFGELTNIAWDNYYLYDSNMNLLISTGGGGTGYKVIDLDTYTDPKYIKLSFKRGNNNVAVSGTIKPMIEVGETPTTYEAYNVVYGGYIDLINRKLI